MTGPTLPLIHELHPAPEPVEAFRAWGHLPHCLFLDSAMPHEQLGRYSFLVADPYDFVKTSAGDAQPLQRLASKLPQALAETVPGLPPFQGGAAGLIGYDLNRSLERIPAPRWCEFDLPTLAFGFYDVVLAWDHQVEKAWLISTGESPDATIATAANKLQRATERLHFFQDCLRTPIAQSNTSATAAKPLSLKNLAPSFETGVMPDLLSNFSADDYQRMIQRGIDYIHAGDVFQVNLSQRLLYPARDSSMALYERLRSRNPATFAAFFDVGDYQILSASPERLVSARDGRVEARPIKGTRPLMRWPEADLYAGQSLLTSEKDRAENIMIVDLLRNDLSRVCRSESVRVSQLCGLESYRYVQHLVSVIEGELKTSADAVQLVEAVFPGGSITGAPKVRAMEIIAELEPTARGAYCGSLGYIGFDGSVDLSILIRTITAGRGWWQLPVGGGIVSDSQPADELNETWHKAYGLLRAIAP